jgi:hypothetical protein
VRGKPECGANHNRAPESAPVEALSIRTVE